jgi:hypothetical protein
MATRPTTRRSRKRKKSFCSGSPPQSEALSNTAHFLARVEQRLNGLSRRKQKRFRLLYDALSKDEARTAALHGKYAFQFGGDPRRQGDYLVAEVSNGRTVGFITLLVNQFVPHQQATRVVSAKSVMPPTSAYKNPYDWTPFFSRMRSFLPSGTHTLLFDGNRFSLQSPAGTIDGIVMIVPPSTVEVEYEVKKKSGGHITTGRTRKRVGGLADSPKRLATLIRMALPAHANPSPLSQLAARRQQEAENSLGVSLPVSWDIGPYKHFRNPRGFGVTFTHHKNPKWDSCHVRLSKKLLDSDVGRQDGIIQHELGHVIDIMVIPDHLDRWALNRGVRLPPQKLGELRADAIAHAVWQKPLLYEEPYFIQNTEKGVFPRPRCLGW